MSGRANCYDNAAMESFWSTLKEELVHRRTFTSRAEAAGAIFDYIKPLTTASGSTAPSAIYLLWNLKSRLT